MKSLINTITLSLLLHSGKAIHNKKDYSRKEAFDNKDDSMLYASSIASGSKLREMDYSESEKVKAASETTQSPYFMAMDQKEISTTGKVADHELVAGDFVKNKVEEPNGEDFELLMIKSALNRAKEDLWGQ